MYDKEIRKALKGFLMNRKPSPSKIVDELKVNNGFARADVVALYKYAHCFEIKGDKDSLSRVSNQVSQYDLAFKKITIVTTSKLLDSLELKIPNYWGILLAERNDDAITFKYLRKANSNPNFNGEVALLSLWKDELIAINSVIGKTQITKSQRRELIAQKLSEESTLADIASAVSQALFNRERFPAISK